MIDGYRTYLYYQAIRLHFTEKKFDAIQNNGRVKIPRQRFLDRSDKVIFDRLASKLKEDHEVANFMISNFVDGFGSKEFIYNTEKAMSTFINWKMRRDSLSYVFELDSAHLDTVLSNSKNVYMTLLRELINKKISPETFVALNKFYKIFDNFTQEFLWSEYELLLTKYESFVKIKSNHQQYFDNLEKYFTESK